MWGCERVFRPRHISDPGKSFHIIHHHISQSHNSTWSDWNPIDESLLFLWMYLWWINYLPRSLKFFLHHKWVLRWLMLILLDGVTAKRRLSSESGSMDSLEKGFFVSTLLSFQAWKSGWSGVGRSHGNSIHHQRRGEKERERYWEQIEISFISYVCSTLHSPKPWRAIFDSLVSEVRW